MDDQHFKYFRENTIGHRQQFLTPCGMQTMLYADWIASGRLFRPVEARITDMIGPYVGNTHTETSETGTLMTLAYHEAQRKIKRHVNAGPDDVIITSGFGMTSVINKFQRILGMRVCGEVAHSDCLKNMEKPVVFISHMEHHSNHTSWFETNAEVVQVPPGDDLLFDLNRLEELLKKYSARKVKIGSFTACSNVTGLQTPVHEMAELMHRYGGVCFIDYAASAPYVPVNMHPDNEAQKLDAIFFSPHKFLGGPGSSGVLVFDSSLYHAHTPDQPGGGTVDWTNAWGEYKYIDDIEAREDGGTPGFLQAIRTALSIGVKEKMNPEKMKAREEELVALAFREFSSVPGIRILAEKNTDRLGIFSFYIEDLHYNLIVKILNDRYGIQVRGGCACAGTYGHFLLDVSYDLSKHITDLINSGDLSQKPGWVRVSLHPTMEDSDVKAIAAAVGEISRNHKNWSSDYIYSPKTNEFRHLREANDKAEKVRQWLYM